MAGEGNPGELDRRELLVKGTGALLAAGLAGGLASRAAGAVRLPRSTPGRPAGPRPVDNVILNTVTGPGPFYLGINERGFHEFTMTLTVRLQDITT